MLPGARLDIFVLLCTSLDEIKCQLPSTGSFDQMYKFAESRLASNWQEYSKEIYFRHNFKKLALDLDFSHI